MEIIFFILFVIMSISTLVMICYLKNRIKEITETHERDLNDFRACSDSLRDKFNRVNDSDNKKIIYCEHKIDELTTKSNTNYYLIQDVWRYIHKLQGSEDFNKDIIHKIYKNTGRIPLIFIDGDKEYELCVDDNDVIISCPKNPSLIGKCILIDPSTQITRVYEKSSLKMKGKI